MAKKKVTKKKTRPASSRKAPAKKKPAAKGTGKKTLTKKKVAKKAASAKPPSKKKTVKKTTTKKKPTVKKTAPKVTVTKKTPTSTAAAGKKKKKKLTTKKVSILARSRKGKGKSGPPPAPDANGYVIINGRRVRMMSVVEILPTPVKRVSRAKADSEPIKKSTGKPTKTKLSKKDLDHYRSLLLTQRAELVGDLGAIESQALQTGGGNISHMPIHMADVGTDTFDQDFMLGLAETERLRLREIDEALKRIEDRTYGVCQMTGKPIPKSRLNAKPWARYTIEAARQVEQGVTE